MAEISATSCNAGTPAAVKHFRLKTSGTDKLLESNVLMIWNYIQILTFIIYSYVYQALHSCNRNTVYAKYWPSVEILQLHFIKYTLSVRTCQMGVVNLNKISILCDAQIVCMFSLF